MNDILKKLTKKILKEERRHPYPYRPLVGRWLKLERIAKRHDIPIHTLLDAGADYIIKHFEGKKDEKA